MHAGRAVAWPPVHIFNCRLCAALRLRWPDISRAAPPPSRTDKEVVLGVSFGDLSDIVRPGSTIRLQDGIIGIEVGPGLLL